MAGHQGIESWFQTPHGSRVIHHLHDQLLPLTKTIKGECLLQLGAMSHSKLSNDFSFAHKWFVSEVSLNVNNNAQTILASYDFLPFEDESVNTIFVPLSLTERSFSNWPLDEIDRVLKSMGYVIFCAINPISLWGASLKFQSTSFINQKVDKIPSLLQLKRALSRRGLQHYYANNFYYLPPFSRNVQINRFQFLEQMGGLFPPWPAAFYLLVMKKSSFISPDPTCSSLGQTQVSII